MRALFVSKNLIGDALYVGPALRAWIKKNPNSNVYLLTLNDHITPLYEGMVRDMLGKELCTFRTVFDRSSVPEVEFEHTFDVSAAFKLSDQKKQHLATSYADMLGVKIGDKKEDLKPIYLPDHSLETSIPEEYILVSMFSMSCTSHDPKCNYVPNKCLPWEKWVPMLKFLEKLGNIPFPVAPIRFLGAPTDVIPDELMIYGQPMLGIPLNRLALVMRKAKLLVTIDNGMAHLGASQEVCTFEMYPKALGLHYILPIGNKNLVFVHMHPPTVDPAYLLNGLQYAVSKFEKTIWRKK